MQRYYLQKKQLDYEARSTRNGISANHLLNFSLPERERPVQVRKKKASAEPRTQSEYLHAKYVSICWIIGDTRILLEKKIGKNPNSYRFVISQLEKGANVPTWDLEALTECTLVLHCMVWPVEV